MTVFVVADTHVLLSEMRNAVLLRRDSFTCMVVVFVLSFTCLISKAQTTLQSLPEVPGAPMTSACQWPVF